MKDLAAKEPTIEDRVSLLEKQTKEDRRFYLAIGQGLKEYTEDIHLYLLLGSIALGFDAALVLLIVLGVFS